MVHSEVYKRIGLLEKAIMVVPVISILLFKHQNPKL